MRPAQPDTARLDALRARGDRPALTTERGAVTYAELADRVEATARTLGDTRRLVLVQAGNDPDSVVAWLATWIGGHVGVLARPEDPVEPLVACFSPDAHLLRGTLVRCEEPRTVLHPDLALLLPTSGSTGRSKIVRLPGAGLHANAAAIVEALGVRATDVAALNLPLAYAYGLSVLHSHLAAGACVWLTERSVADPHFADHFDARSATTLPGVPYTFDLLASTHFFDRAHPSLRLVTQAGGRLAPAQVRALATLGERQGWGFVAMYGQTEATARITALPAALAASYPTTVGRPVPGVQVLLDEAAADSPGVGEVLVRGPSVMLGYAEGPADLARGAGTDVLRTGDLGRWTPNGLLELTGRRGRVVKPFGQRVDLDGLEGHLRDVGLRAAAHSGEHWLGVVVEACAAASSAGRSAAAWARLPERVVRVVEVERLPRLASGKVDGAAVRQLLEAAERAEPGRGSVATVFREVLGCADVPPTASFASLGGDSLTYVAVVSRIGALIDPLPRNWPELPLVELERLVRAPTASTGGPRTETGVVLRAAGITLVTASHAGLAGDGGGAHLLLLVAGYHFARFHLTGASRRERTLHIARSLARWLVPAAAWLAVLAAVDPRYGPELMLVNHLVSPPDAPAWRFWFVETLFYLQVLGLLAIAAGDRLERRAPFAFALGVAVTGGLELLTLGRAIPNLGLTPWGTLWIFGLGWAIQRARDVPGRVGLALVVALVASVFGAGVRGAAFLVGGLLLLLVPTIPLPSRVARVVALLASSSLAIYLTHFPLLDLLPPGSWFALPLALSVGTSAWLVLDRLVGRARRPRGGSEPGRGRWASW